MDAGDLAVLPLRRMLVPGPAASRAESAAGDAAGRVLAVTRAYHQARYMDAVQTLPELVSDLTAATGIYVLPLVVDLAAEDADGESDEAPRGAGEDDAHAAVPTLSCETFRARASISSSR